MLFHTKPLSVEAQQFTTFENVTLIELRRTPTGFGFDTEEGFMLVEPNDWIVKWNDGAFQVYSAADFEHRFSSEDSFQGLKDTIEMFAFVKNLKTETNFRGTVENYDAHVRHRGITPRA